MQSSDANVSSITRSSAISAACIADLLNYMESFNQANLNGIRDCLDDNIEIHVDSKLAAQGRDSILPSYEADFKVGKQVKIIEQPEIVQNDENKGEVSLRVTLEASSTETETTCIDVIYTYDTSSMRQVRHEIFLTSNSDGRNTIDAATQELSVGSKRAELKSWDAFMEYDKHYMTQLSKMRQNVNEPYANLAFGNPQDPPLPELVAALQRPMENKANLSLGYKMSHPETINAIVQSLQQTRFLPPHEVDPQDIFLTNGALAALSFSMFVLADPGEEVIMLTPKYFFYESMAEYAGLRAVLVPANAEQGFDVDIRAIRNAITPKTRILMLNSPNNPTGKIYPMETLRGLASMLQEVNETRRQAAKAEGSTCYSPIVVISDEAYCRIVFDHVEYHSIAEVYPYTVMVYTWAKTLLCPSERFGYICLSPLLPLTIRKELRDKFCRAQLVGWSFPNGTTMQAYAHVADVCIDVARMQNRRNRLHRALTRDGCWNASQPQGGFYMMVQVPSDRFRDENDLLDALLQERVLAVPGSIMDVEGWIRLSLSASDEMIDFAIGAFRRIWARRSGQP